MYFILLFIHQNLFTQEYLNEDFNAGLPSDWTSISLEVENPWTWKSGIPGDNTLNGTGFAMVNAEGVEFSDHIIEILESPNFDASAANITVLSFDTYYYDYWVNDSAFVDVYNGSEWINVWKRGVSVGTWNNPVTITIIIDDYINTSGNSKIRFRYDDNDEDNWNFHWAIDNVLVESVDCVAPQQLELLELGAIHTFFSWQDAGSFSTIVYGGTFFDPDGTEGTTIDSVYSPFQLNNLLTQTSYDVYVNNNCGINGSSEWSGPIQFTTTSACPNPSNLDHDYNNITSTSVDLEFERNGVGDIYLILGSLYFDLGEEGDTIGPVSSPYTITGLSPETDYTLYIYMDCEYSDLGYSNTEYFADFTTDVACPVPNIYYDDNIVADSNSIEVSYINSSSSVYAIFGEYPFDIGTSGDTILLDTNPFTFENLNPATRYQITLFGDCSEDNNGYSANDYTYYISTFTNEAGTSCDNPVILNDQLPYYGQNETFCGFQDILVSNVNGCIDKENREEKVYLLSPEEDDTYNFYINSSAVSGYFYRVLTITELCPDDENSICIDYVGISSNDTSATLSVDLEANKDYYIMVQGYNYTDCNYNLSITRGSCDIPTNQSYIAYPDSTVLSWESNGNATSWEVTWGYDGMPYDSELATTVYGDYDTDGSSVAITGLEVGSFYSFYVRDICGPGWESGHTWAGTAFTGPGASNDLCENAIELNCADTLTGDTRFASTSDNPSIYCGSVAYAEALWYSIEGNGLDFRVDIEGLNYYPGINIYSGECGDLTCIAGDSGGWEYQKHATFSTNAGEVYYLLVSGYSDYQQSRGEFEITLNCGICPDIPYLVQAFYSDTAVSITWESVNIGAVYDIVLTYSIGINVFQNDTITGMCDSTNNVLIGGLTPGTYYEVQLYESCSDNLQSVIETLEFTTNLVAAAENDLCYSAALLQCGDELELDGNTITSVGNPNNFICSSYIFGALGWYKVIGDDSQVTIKTCGSDFPAKLYLFGGSCDSLFCMDEGISNDISCSYSQWQNQAKLEFFAEDGEEYYVAIGGAWDNYQISMECDGCGEPSLVSYTTEDTISTINWISNTPLTNYTLAYSMSNLDWDEATVVDGLTIFDLPYTIDGLLAATEYEVCVFGFCNENMQNSDTVCISWTTNFAPTPINDNVCDAIPLEEGVVLSTTNLYASSEPGEPSPEEGLFNDPDQLTWGEATVNSSTWYSFTPGGNGYATISTCEENSYDTQLAVYSATDCSDFSSFTLLAANDDNYNCSANTNGDANRTSTVELCLEGNETYYIQVDPFDFFNVPAGNEFGISVNYVENSIDGLLAFPSYSSCVINWNYTSFGGNDEDYILYYTNLTTNTTDSISGNTEDLPVLIEGLDSFQNYNFYVIMVDDCATESELETFVTSEANGINIVKDQYELSIYPIPAKDKLTINFSGDVSIGTKMRIVNIQGKLIYQYEFSEKFSSFTQDIELDDFASGVYLFELINMNYSIQRRIIVQ